MHGLGDVVQKKIIFEKFIETLETQLISEKRFLRFENKNLIFLIFIFYNENSNYQNLILLEILGFDNQYKRIYVFGKLDL